MTAGNLYSVAGSATVGLSGDGGPATGAGLRGPAGVAIDGAGNLLIADNGDDRIRLVNG
jgi:glucose/arabinose dehydrogenase